MNREVGNQARWPTENSVKRENRPARRKAENWRRDPERRFKPTERGAPPVAPLVKIPKQDGRHRRQIKEGRQKGADLIHS
jgi:hypothetical protein